MSIVNRYIIIITLHALIHKADAQSLFSDTTIMAMVRQGATHIYKGQIDSAENIILRVEERLPGHPVVSAMESFLILWQYIPVFEDSVFEVFKHKLEEVIAKCEILEEDGPEAIVQSRSNGKRPTRRTSHHRGLAYDGRGSRGVW